MTISLLYGNEPYLIDNEIKKVKSAFEDDLMNIAEYEVFDLNTVESLQIAPLMASKRLVIVKGMDILNDTLFQYLQNPTPTSDLILVCSTIDKRKKAFKLLQKQYLVVQYSKLHEAKALAFVVKHSVLDQGQAAYMLTRIGYHISDDVNLYDVRNAVLRLNELGKTIDNLLIDELVEENIESAVFALIDAIFNNDVDIVIRLIRPELEKKNGIGLLSLLLRNFRIMYKLALGCNQKDIGLSSYEFNKLSHYSISKNLLLEQIEMCNLTIKNIKMGERSQDVSLSFFILQLMCKLQDERK